MEKSADRVEFKLQLEYLKFLEVKTDGIKKDELPRLLVDNKHIESIEKYHSLGQYEKVRLLVEILDVNKRTKKSLSDRFQRNGNASVINGILMQIEIFVAGILKDPSIKEDAELRLSSAILICNTGSMHNLVLLNHSLFCSAGIDGLLMSWKGEFMHQLAKRYLSEDIDVRMMIMDRDPIAHEIHDIGALLYLVKDEWNLYDIKKEVHMRLDKFTPIINSWKEIIAKFIVAQDIVTIIADDIIWRFDVAMKSAPQVTENHKNIDKLSELWSTFFKDDSVISMLCDGNENGITGFHPHYRNVIRAQTLVQLSSLGAIECDGIEEIKGALTAFAEANEDYIYEGKIARPNFDLFDISSSSEELVITNLQEDEVINKFNHMTSNGVLCFTANVLLCIRSYTTDNIIIAALNRMNANDVFCITLIMIERGITITDAIAIVAFNNTSDKMVADVILTILNNHIAVTDAIARIAFDRMGEEMIANVICTIAMKNIAVTDAIARIAFDRMSKNTACNVIFTILNKRIAVTDAIARIAFDRMDEEMIANVICTIAMKNIAVTDAIVRIAFDRMGKEMIANVILTMINKRIAVTDAMARIAFDRMSKDNIGTIILTMININIAVTDAIVRIAFDRMGEEMIANVILTMINKRIAVTDAIARIAFDRMSENTACNVIFIILNNRITVTDDIVRIAFDRMSEENIGNVICTIAMRNIAVTDDIVMIAFDRMSKNTAYNVIFTILNNRITVTDTIVRIAFDNMSKDNIIDIICDILDAGIAIKDDIVMIAFNKMTEAEVCDIILKMQHPSIQIQRLYSRISTSNADITPDSSTRIPIAYDGCNINALIHVTEGRQTHAEQLEDDGKEEQNGIHQQ